MGEMKWRKTVREMKRVGVHGVDRNEVGCGRRQEVRRRNTEIQSLLKKLKMGNARLRGWVWRGYDTMEKEKV
jgi:hypothetical protein